MFDHCLLLSKIVVTVKKWRASISYSVPIRPFSHHVPRYGNLYQVCSKNRKIYELQDVRGGRAQLSAKTEVFQIHFLKVGVAGTLQFTPYTTYFIKVVLYPGTGANYFTHLWLGCRVQALSLETVMIGRKRQRLILRHMFCGCPNLWTAARHMHFRARQSCREVHSNPGAF